MKEIENTRKYLETLKKVYREQGLRKAINHELTASILSIGSKIETSFYFIANGLEYLAEAVTDGIDPFGPLPEKSRVFSKMYKESREDQKKNLDLILKPDMLR